MAKMENEPTVSVIIPTYNRAHLLGETVQSVLNQAYQDFEVIIVDDASTDNTEEVVGSFNDGRLRYIKLKENSGASAVPRNTGLKAASGRYIALLDSDDVWLPNKLELEVKCLDTHPAVGLVYSNYTYFGTRASIKRTGFEGFSLASGHVLKEFFLGGSPISSSAVLVRRSCFDKVGLFDESITQCGDLDMWLRIARYFEIDYIDVPLARYRLHEGNRFLDFEGTLTGAIAMRRKCLESNPFLLDEIDSKMMHAFYYSFYLKLGDWYLSNGASKKARAQFREYVRLSSWDLGVYISWLITFLPPRLTPWVLVRWRELTSYLARVLQAVLNKFPSSLRPGLIKLHRALYPRFVSKGR